MYTYSGIPTHNYTYLHLPTPTTTPTPTPIPTPSLTPIYLPTFIQADRHILCKYTYSKHTYICIYITYTHT